MLETAAFILFAGLAIGCALAVVLQRNPLYSAISLIGVFLSLACLYVMLASPFIAAVQILVYAGAIMVLVVFVIMLLNVEEDLFTTKRLKSLTIIGVIMGFALAAQALFIFYAVTRALPNNQAATDNPTMGSPFEIGKSLFTVYLLPFEITGVLLLMAIVGAMMLSRRLQPEQLEEVLEEERDRRHDN
ncbi:MAG: NADH-quinone oxidoreductase subunit J [Acidobacteriota bacterium]|nr:NADH-quinone oxidoreductase subunit J [Acidobacteriota bacterium]